MSLSVVAHQLAKPSDCRLRVQTPKKSLLRVALVSLREGKVIRNVMVGEGGDGSICVSRDAIALVSPRFQVETHT